MAELVKFKVTGSGVTDGTGDVEPGEVIEISARSAQDLVKAKKGEILKAVKATGTQEQGQDERDEDLGDSPEVQEYQKLYKALDSYKRDNIYEVAKGKVEIAYDINKKPLIEAIIDAGKAQVILDALAEKE